MMGREWQAWRRALVLVLLVTAACGGSGPVWSVTLEGEASAPVLSPRGSLVVVTSAPALYSIDESGKTEWRVPLDGVSPGSESTDGPGGPVIFENGDIVVPAGPAALARYSADGELLWQMSLPVNINAELAALPDGSVAVPGSAGTLLVVRADGTTSMEFRDETSSSLLSWSVAPAVTADGALVGVLGSRSVIRVEKDGSRGWLHRAESSTQALALGSGGHVLYLSRSGSDDPSSMRGLIVLGPDGQVRWNALLPEGALYEPAVDADGSVHVVSDSYGRGPLLLRYREAGAREEVMLPESAVCGPLLVEGGVRIVRLEGHRLHLYDARGSLLQEVELPSWRTAPVLAPGGALYATAANTLHRIDLEVDGLANAPWARPRANNRASGSLIPLH